MLLLPITLVFFEKKNWIQSVPENVQLTYKKQIIKVELSLWLRN